MVEVMEDGEVGGRFQSGEWVRTGHPSRHSTIEPSSK